MSDFSDIMSDGFGVMLELGGGTKISANGVTKDCVTNGIEQRIRMTKVGYEYFGSVPPVCDMRRADFLALGLKETERAEILLSKPGAPRETVELELLAIQNGAEDDFVHLVFQFNDPAS